MRNKKIGIISSCGGHFTEVAMLMSVYANYDHFYVFNDKITLPENITQPVYFITHSERDLKLILNFWEAFKILRREKPQLLLSTGAGAIVPFALMAKFFKIKTVYIETVTSIDKPSLTGRIMYYLTDFFYYQWPTLKKYFPKGECIGTLL